MSGQIVEWLEALYGRLLGFYPGPFREAFGAEMRGVFREAVGEAAARGAGAVVVVCLRELRDAPGALMCAYRREGPERWRTWAARVRAATPVDDLPPPGPDGRDSWRQAALEVSFFALAGALLLGMTYGPWTPPPGWQRDMALLGRVATLPALAAFLPGLARGLPRWAYPYGGLLIGFQTHFLGRTASGWFAAMMLLAYAALGLAALATNPAPGPLPAALRRIAQSLTLDWTRLSFAVYGMAPLVIVMAFDDGYTNDRTPYPALAALAMVMGALVYARARNRALAVGALLGGLVMVAGAAWLGHVAVAERWLDSPAAGAAQAAWLARLAISWMALAAAPAALAWLGRAARASGGAVRAGR